MPNSDKCSKCNGTGYLHNDVPVSDPTFGQVLVCECRKKAQSRFLKEKMVELSNLGVYSDFTFEAFNVDGRGHLQPGQKETLVEAISAAKEFAKDPKGFLVITGGYGVGKTHLAAAIAHEAIKNGVQVLMMDVPALLNMIRDAISTREQEDTINTRIDEIQNVELLILDDLGAQKSTDWAEETLYQIINHRYRRMSLVVTSNVNMQRVEGRIGSRLSDISNGKVIKIQAPDYRGGITNNSKFRWERLPSSKFSFQTFSLRADEPFPDDQKKDIAQAVNVAKNFAQNPNGTLIIHGVPNSGKTHLGLSIAGELRHNGHGVVCVSTLDLLDSLRLSFMNDTHRLVYVETMELLQSVPVLILDNFDIASSTVWAQEKVFQILDQRFAKGLNQVILTDASSNPPERLEARFSSSDIKSAHLPVAYGYSGYPVGGKPTKKPGRGKPKDPNSLDI